MVLLPIEMVKVLGGGTGFGENMRHEVFSLRLGRYQTLIRHANRDNEMLSG